MDSNLLVAIVTSVCTAGSTAGVAITALMLSTRRIDRLEAAMDRMTTSVDARLEMLTGAVHELDKRLSIIEDRVGR
jgi:hypothetical protein